MSTKRSITTQKVLDECTEAWRPLEEVVASAIPTVPPGKALRKFEMKTQNNGGKPEFTEDQKIYSGARYFVTASVATLRNSNTLETATIDGVQMVRRRNKQVFKDAGVCPECHRPYDVAEGQDDPFAGRENHPSQMLAKVIFPPQFNKRRFG